jgi:hypothetical protein
LLGVHPFFIRTHTVVITPLVRGFDVVLADVFARCGGTGSEVEDLGQREREEVASRV